MTPQNLPSAAPPATLLAAFKPRLLVISDLPERARIWRTRIHPQEIEVTEVASLAELRTACREPHQMAIVDLDGAQIREALRLLRASAAHAAVSILVATRRLPAGLEMAGVLAQFRAMPCSDRELVALARQRLAPSRGRQSKRTL